MAPSQTSAEERTDTPSEADPMLAPIGGVTLEMYAVAAQEAHLRGVSDEDGLAAVAEDVYGVPAAIARDAFGTWAERLAVSPAVGRELRHHMGLS